jgi:beta-lactamase class A
MARDNLSVLLVTMLAVTPLFACAGSTSPRSASPPVSRAVAASPAVVAATTPVTPPLPPGVPDSPAGRQLTWVLGAMTSAPSESEVTAHFTQEFLAKVPAPTVIGLFRQIAAASPFTVESVSPSKESRPDELVAVVRPSRGPRVSVVLAVDSASSRMRGLLFRPKLDVKLAESWEEVQGALRAVAPLVSFLAAEVDGGKCVPISSIEPQKPLALGSTFKLYVLDALARQVASGKHGWNDPVAVQDALKSLPPGAMREEPDGKTFPIHYFAEQMISVSDNTAADHLLALVGRKAVEDAVKASGHAAPARLQPFLSTREAFALKMLSSPDERKAYVAADVAHKRTLLGAYAQRDTASAMAQTVSSEEPISIDTIEWFASAEDLCKVMVDLHARADVAATAPVAAILSKNPGIPDENKQYAYVGFKGGGEPGVLNVTWLLQRARDGKWLVLTAGFNNPVSAVDELKAFAATASAREFLGR